jgi:hypothetical protein
LPSFQVILYQQLTWKIGYSTLAPPFGATHALSSVRAG